MRIVLFAAASFAALRIQQLMDPQYSSTGKRAAVTHLAKSRGAGLALLVASVRTNSRWPVRLIKLAERPKRGAAKP